MAITYYVPNLMNVQLRYRHILYLYDDMAVWQFLKSCQIVTFLFHILQDFLIFKQTDVCIFFYGPERYLAENLCGILSWNTIYVNVRIFLICAIVMKCFHIEMDLYTELIIILVNLILGYFEYFYNNIRH